VADRSFRIVGAPFELGSRTSGPAQAPDALRSGGLTALAESLSRRGMTVSDLGDVAAPNRGEAHSTPRHLKELLAYSEELVPRLIDVYSTGSCPIVIGGDHAVSIPSVSAAAAAIRKLKGDDAQLGLVWVDAHPDLETPETTPSGDLHGMAAAALLGFGATELVELGGFSPKVLPENVAFIGLRDVLPCERELIESNGMRAYTATDIDRLGIANICDQVFGHMSSAVSAFVLSFDVDACDPMEAPGVEYPERGGLTFREARLIGECAADTAGLACVEVLEVIPELDREARSTQLAVSFLESVVAGKPVYRPGQPN
jgi:arginase